MGTKGITKDALEAEERGDFVEAVRQYKDAVGCDSWSDGPPMQVEEDLWEDSLLQVRAEECVVCVCVCVVCVFVCVCVCVCVVVCMWVWLTPGASLDSATTV